MRIDHAGDAGVGGADERRAVLDRPHAQGVRLILLEGGASEPGVVGDDDPGCRSDVLQVLEEVVEV